MKPSSHAQLLLKNMDFKSMKLLAASQNRLDLFLELMESNDFEKISKKLGLIIEFDNYSKIMDNNRQLSAKEQAGLMTNFRSFLIEKICLPVGFDKIEI